MTRTNKVIYVISSMTMMLMIGAVYTYSVFRPHVQSLFDISETLSGIPYMTSLFFYAISMMITGRILTLKNHMKLSVIGLCLIILGWVVSSYAPSYIVFVLSYGVLIGTGVGIVYGIPIKGIQTLYPERSGFYTGLILLGFGLSTLVVAPLSAYLIGQMGIYTTFRMFGLAYVLMLIPLIYGMRLPLDIELKQTQSIHAVQQFPFKLPRLYSYFVVATTIGLMMIGLSYSIGVTRYGFSVWHVAFSMSLFALMNGLARPLFGYFMDRKGFTWSASLSMVLWILASLIAIINQGRYLSLFMVAYSLYWFNLGAWLAMIPATIKLKYPKHEYSKRYGFVFTGYGIGAIIGTLLSGFIMDLFGETTYLYLFIGLLAAFLITELYLKQRK